MSDYLLDNAWQQQGERLGGLEAWFDPGTIRHLRALGVGPGWRCVEVGAGGGSIARWLSAQVGPSGHVVATDLDTRLVAQHAEANLEVRRHDIAAEALEPAAYDLAHARFVLEHLPDRIGALRRMRAALKPGGWLLIENTDSSSWLPDPATDAADQALFLQWTAAYCELCRQAGADAYAGRHLFGEMTRLGLADVGAEGRVFMVRGGSPPAEVWRLTAVQVRPRILATGLLTAAEMGRVEALLADPRFVWMEGLVMAAWGRVPE